MDPEQRIPAQHPSPALQVERRLSTHHHNPPERAAKETFDSRLPEL
ncbi:MAG: hypothetical protein ACREQZ_13375 [Woeseiaceae bacterium]